ncbi:beta-1,3-galactosyltransferase 5-like isoform X2 [Pomacea canaliculata]|uniref:beta-1,3-galactosyltransferase 5-like isoform X2 n=1 Tax=Pomacea canaliculata TaxID=400727 RepID=UPI000D727E0D|nr:beta-1,3-galactosyltransferase 5-like isoform X2 [Pomacea canaliculata]
MATVSPHTQRRLENVGLACLLRGLKRVYRQYCIQLFCFVIFSTLVFIYTAYPSSERSQYMSSASIHERLSPPVTTEPVAGSLDRKLNKTTSLSTQSPAHVNRTTKDIFNKIQTKNVQHDLTASWNYLRNLHTIVQSLQLIDEDYLRDNSSFFQLRPHVVNSFVPKVIIQAFPLCPEDGPFLLVAVPSVADHTEQREAIRKTWGSLARGGSWPRRSGPSYEMKVVFFLGVLSKANMTELKAESDLYGDIVMGDFVESYRNLTIKMGFVLHWSVTFCANTQHVLKIDEDTFVNMPLLFDLLATISNQRKVYILGHRHTHSKPAVVRYGRWEVDRAAYPLPYFPRYLYGHSYVISHDALSSLLLAFHHMPTVLSEDSHLTGILAKTMNIPRIHCPYFAVISNTNKCRLLEDVVSLTSFRGAKDLLKMWDSIVTGKCE